MNLRNIAIATIVVVLSFDTNDLLAQVTKTHSYDGKKYTLQENGLPKSYYGDYWECMASGGFGIVQADYYTGFVSGATPGTFTDTVKFIGWHSDGDGTQSMVTQVTFGVSGTVDRFYPPPHWSVSEGVSEGAFENIFMHDSTIVRWRVNSGEYEGEVWDQNVIQDSYIYSPTGGGAFFNVGGMYATSIQDYMVTNVEDE